MVGLLVEAVSDILAATDDMVQPTPDVACDAVKTFVEGILAIEGRMISLVQLDRILPDQEAGSGMSRSAATERTDDALVQGEFPYTAGDFRKIAEILYGLSGIHLPESKATLVYSRLAKRLRALGLQSFHQYCALVADEAQVDERQKMLAALTTNVTRFFREPHHFDAPEVQADAEPGRARRAGGRVRIWSAGLLDRARSPIRWP